MGIYWDNGKENRNYGGYRAQIFRFVGRMSLSSSQIFILLDTDAVRLKEQRMWAYRDRLSARAHGLKLIHSDDGRVEGCFWRAHKYS